MHLFLVHRYATLIIRRFVSCGIVVCHCHGTLGGQNKARSHSGFPLRTFCAQGVLEAGIPTHYAVFAWWSRPPIACAEVRREALAQFVGGWPFVRYRQDRGRGLEGVRGAFTVRVGHHRELPELQDEDGSAFSAICRHRRSNHSKPLNTLLLIPRAPCCLSKARRRAEFSFSARDA